MRLSGTEERIREAFKLASIRSIYHSVIPATTTRRHNLFLDSRSVTDHSELVQHGSIVHAALNAKLGERLKERVATFSPPSSHPT